NARVVTLVKIARGAEWPDAFAKETIARSRQVDLPHGHHQFHHGAMKAIRAGEPGTELAVFVDLELLSNTQRTQGNGGQSLIGSGHAGSRHEFNPLVHA